MSMQVINPSNEQFVKEYPTLSDSQASQVVAAVEKERLLWQETGFAKRRQLLNKAALVLREKKEEYAKLMALEMGKPLNDGRSEIEKCAVVCEYYAAEGETILNDQLIETEAKKSYAAFRPLGIVLAVMPWNFPFWQVFRFAAPALMAANGALLKHASNVPGCALAIEEVFHLAGFPKNIFRSLLIKGDQVAKIIEHHYVSAVTLTGSTPVGKTVAAEAGQVLKKCVLELGGSDPYLILADADIEQAAASCATSRLINAGQSCIAAKRFIVEEPVLEPFTKAFVEKMKSFKMGDPFAEETQIGPQATVKLRDELSEQVKQSVEKGAKCLLGGEVPAGKGAFYPPTVLSNVKKGMPAYDDELFGPVASIISAKNAKEAIEIANDSIFGLGAAVFSKDWQRAEEIAKVKLNAGCCFVNQFVRSDPRLPFGGIKKSGYGRELGSFGIKEFVNVKTVYVK